MQAIESSSTLFTHHSLTAITDGLLGVMIGIFVWAVLAIVVQNEALLPTPFGVARELWYLAESDEHRRDVIATLSRTGVAWILGNIIAIPAGILIGYHSRFFRLLTPWLLLGRSLPIFALVGVAAGLFPRMPEVQRLFLVVLMIAAFSLQAIAAAAGLVPRVRLWLARIYGASAWYQVTRIMPFETRPAIFSAIEVSLPLAIVVVFVIELFLIPQIGLGKHLYNHFNDRDLARLFACVVLPGIIATMIIPIIRWVGARSIRHES